MHQRNFSKTKWVAIAIAGIIATTGSFLFGFDDGEKDAHQRDTIDATTLRQKVLCGSQAHLFSPAHPRTINRHFEWMREYGIDGVLVQRFLPDSLEPVAAKPESVRVLGHAATAAQRTGRVFAVEYDMSGVPADKLLNQITTDWKWLVDEMKITQNPRYLHHGGRPVVGIWGFYPDRFDGKLANQILDAFQTQDEYGAVVIGGVVHSWRQVKEPQ